MCVCCRTKDIVDAEREVIQRHLDRHKWFKHIVDEDDAIIDFIWSYAWLMRETFCGRLCEDHEQCDASRGFRSGFLHDISDGELIEIIRQRDSHKSAEFNRVQLTVIKHHIAMHKWSPISWTSSAES